MESPDGAQWCDFCKEPFAKKPKAAAPAPAPSPASVPAAAPLPSPAAQPPTPSAGDLDALKKLSKEQLAALKAEDLLKADVPATPVPTWLRPVSWLFMLTLLALSAMALAMLYGQYKERQERLSPGIPGQP